MAAGLVLHAPSCPGRRARSPRRAGAGPACPSGSRNCGHAPGDVGRVRARRSSMPTASSDADVVDGVDRRAPAGTGRARRRRVTRLVAGVALEPRPVGVRLLGQPDVRRRVVAVPQDPAGVVARAARVPELEPLEPDDPVPAARELHGRWRCRAPRARRRRSRPARSPPGLQQRQQPAADVEALVLHRREPAVPVAPRRHAALHGLADRPVLAVDQVPQLAGVGGVEARPRAPRRRRRAASTPRRCGRPPVGSSTNAATWSAEADSSRFG